MYYQMKCDLEVYIGIYLTVGWPFGFSSLITVFVVWQFLRFKYMINYCTKATFTSIDTKVSGWVANLGPIRMVYSKFQQFCAWMVKMEAPG